MKKALAIIFAVVLVVVSPVVPAAAIARPTAAQIPVGTLVIGTHLIYAAAMTNAVYDAALSSASDPSLNAQQNSVYYKSEFAGGRWVDISSATNIYDLSAVSGKFVDDSVIDALTLKFYTMPDGKTYDLTTGRKVAVSDIVSPYDAGTQAEMEPLINNLSALDGENEDNFWPIAILNDVLGSNYRDSYTAYLDKAVASLNSALDSMRGAGASVQKREVLSELISALDHRRRARSLNNMRNKVIDSLSRAGELDLQGLISTMSPVVDELETKIQEHLAAGGDDGARGPAGTEDSGQTEDTAQNESGKYKIRKELESNLIDLLASGGSAEDANELLQELANMDNLDSGAVVSPAEELATALEMISSLNDEFLEKLGGGAIEELTAASPNDPYALRAAGEKQERVFENARMELQAAVAAAGLRMGADDYESLVSGLIVKARELEESVQDDASKPASLAAVQSYTDWLNSESRKAGEESEQKSETQLLQIEINKLEEQSKEALDKKDLAAADSLEREIESKSAQLSALEDNIAAGISAAQASLEKLEEEAQAAKSAGDGPLEERLNSQIGSLQAKINALEASLPTDVRAAQEEIALIKQEALQSVEKGNEPDAVAGLESISAFASREPVAALSAIEEIQDAMLRQKFLFGPGGETSAIPAGLDDAQEQISRLIPELRDKASEPTDINNISAEIAAAETSIENLEQELELAKAVEDGKLITGLESKIDSIRTQIKNLEATLPPDVAEARKEIAKLEQGAADAIEKGDAQTLEKNVEAISALAGLNPVSALAAAEALNNMLTARGASPIAGGADFDAALELISQLLPELRDKSSAIGTDNSPKLRELCESMLEPMPNDIPARIEAVLLADDGRGDKNLLALADEYYAAFPAARVFNVAVSEGERYVPASVLPYYLNLRFLSEKNNMFLLANGAAYYRFTKGIKAVETNADSMDMNSPAYYSGNVAYLPESFIESQFGLSVLVIRHKGTTAILIDKVGRQKAAGIASAMKGE